MTSNHARRSELERIETSRLTLTAHTLDDFARFLYAPGRFAQRFGLANAPGPLERDVRTGLTRRYDAARGLDDGKGVWENLWSVVTREGRSFVGAFCFKGFPEGKDAEIAYYVEEAFRNLGFMTETLRALVDWARKRDDVAAITAETLLTNLASQRVLVKAGFRLFHGAPFVDDDSCGWRVELGRAPY